MGNGCDFSLSFALVCAFLLASDSHGKGCIGGATFPYNLPHLHLIKNDKVSTAARLNLIKNDKVHTAIAQIIVSTPKMVLNRPHLEEGEVAQLCKPYLLKGRRKRTRHPNLIIGVALLQQPPSIARKPTPNAPQVALMTLAVTFCRPLAVTFCRPPAGHHGW